MMQRQAPRPQLLLPVVRMERKSRLLPAGGGLSLAVRRLLCLSCPAAAWWGIMQMRLEMMCLESEFQSRKSLQNLWGASSPWRTRSLRRAVLVENQPMKCWTGQVSGGAKFAQQCIHPSSLCRCSSRRCPLQRQSTSEGTVSQEIDCWVNIMLFKQSKLAINHCLVSLAKAFCRAQYLCLLHLFFWMSFGEAAFGSCQRTS